VRLASTLYREMFLADEKTTSPRRPAHVQHPIARESALRSPVRYTALAVRQAKELRRPGPPDKNVKIRYRHSPHGSHALASGFWARAAPIPGSRSYGAAFFGRGPGRRSSPHIGTQTIRSVPKGLRALREVRRGFRGFPLCGCVAALWRDGCC